MYYEKKDVDKFYKKLNDGIDKIIEDDESEKEVAFFKPSQRSLYICFCY